MEEWEMEELRIRRNKKLLFLYSMFLLLIFAFLFSVFHTITSDRDIPAKTSVINNRALRGDIVSKDGYILSSSYKIYQATVYVNNIDPDKEELFFKLFSIYSDMNRSQLWEKFYTKDNERRTGRVVLTNNLNAKRAIQLKSLAFKLQKLKVFRASKNSNGINVVYGLDIDEVGEARRFPLNDCLTPIIGYVRKKDSNRYTRPIGMKGIERYAQKYLISRVDGLLEGDRDVVGAIIRNGSSNRVVRVDGLDLHLNIVLSLQKRVEMILDEMREETGSEEILGAVMESKTGKLLAIASSQRFDPHNITDKDVSALNPKFAEYPYEIGSIMKPFTLAIALDHDRITPDSWINTHNGHLRIGRGQFISDDDKFPSLTATDVIVHSSNVGISQISWMLSGEEFRKGLLNFGLSQPSGIDLSRDLPGMVKPLKLLKNKMHRANQSYGYGMHATFAQMLKAYSAFNNGGKTATPRIIDYFKNVDGKHYRLPMEQSSKSAVKKKTADEIHKILVEVIRRGTGVEGKYPGLEVGGKTGTAHIATSAGYSRMFHSSFFGFANDNSGHKYTIGVLVIKASKPYKYFASQSAVPTFKEITNSLVELDYLKPQLTAQERVVEQQKLLEEEKKHGFVDLSHAESEVNSQTNNRVKRVVTHKKKKKEHRLIKYKPKTYENINNNNKVKVKRKPPEELFNDLDMF